LNHGEVSQVDGAAMVDVKGGAVGTLSTAVGAGHASFEGVVVVQIDEAIFVVIAQRYRKPESGTEFEAAAGKHTCVRLTDGPGEFQAAACAAHYTAAVDRRSGYLESSSAAAGVNVCSQNTHPNEAEAE
jgi:hypothetical protein